MQAIFQTFCCSFAQSCLTLRPHGLQHTRLPCPSPSPKACPSSCPLPQWCHPDIPDIPDISSSDALFFCPQSFPALGTFLMSCMFTSDDQNTGASDWASFSSVQFSCSVVSDSLRPHESQHARPPCPSPTPGVHSDSCPSVSDAIQPSHPLLSPSPPAPNPSQHQSLFQWINSSHEVAKVLEFQL